MVAREMTRRRSRRGRASCARYVVWLVGAVVPAAHAAPQQLQQLAQIGGFGGAPLETANIATDHADAFADPGRSDAALILGSWLLYPTGFAGAVYDSNVGQTNVAHGSPGIRLSSALLAQNFNDLFQTTLYYNSDARLYFNTVPGNGSIITARLGAREIYTPMNDLSISAQADYTRQSDVFSTLGTDQSMRGLNPTGNGLSPTNTSQPYDQYAVSASVQKNFSRTFIAFDGSAVDLNYGQSSGITASSPNQIVYTGTAKGGFWVLPVLYTFLQGSIDSRDYGNATSNSSGYRITAGVGSDQIGLVRGEAFIGYQSETAESGNSVSGNGNVFGVRGHYYPLPELTLDLSIDQTLGASSGGNGTAGTAGSTNVGTYLASANYSLGQEWSANLRAGYITTDYTSSPRRDNAWTIAATVTYQVIQNFGITIEGQHSALSSNFPGQSFDRDLISLGVSYRY